MPYSTHFISVAPTEGEAMGKGEPMYKSRLEPIVRWLAKRMIWRGCGLAFEEKCRVARQMDDGR